MLPLRFVPYHLLGNTPNVVVDGSPTPSTLLTLSHWPGSPTPVEVRADTSAQIALRALDHPEWFDGAEAVSNNHFDQDGLAAAYFLVDPYHAHHHASLLVDLATAGDFATLTHGTHGPRDGARLAMAVAAFADEERSPLSRSVFAGPYADQCGRLYTEMLDLLPGLLDDPASCRNLWVDEDAHLAASLAAIADGNVRIDELRNVDLAVVTVPATLPTGTLAHRFAHQTGREWTEAVHPMAVNAATDMLRVLLVNGHRYRLELRYETWVMLTSRNVARPDPTSDRSPTGSPSWSPLGPHGGPTGRARSPRSSHSPTTPRAASIRPPSGHSSSRSWPPRRRWDPFART